MDKTAKVGAGQLLSAYRGYCSETGEYCRRQDELKTALSAAGYEWKKTKNGAFYFGLNLSGEYF